MPLEIEIVLHSLGPNLPVISGFKSSQCTKKHRRPVSPTAGDGLKQSALIIVPPVEMKLWQD